MNIFVVNNGSGYITNLLQRLDGHNVNAVDYNVGASLKPKNADLIILSGSMHKEVLDTHSDGLPWYRHELDLIKQTDIPIFGICLGLQMVTVALGGDLRKMPNLVKTNKYIDVNNSGSALIRTGKEVYVHKRHQWVADKIENTKLSVLGTSTEGIEIVHHPKRRIIATQFHPEIDADDKSEKLFWNLVSTVA